MMEPSDNHETSRVPEDDLEAVVVGTVVRLGYPPETEDGGAGGCTAERLRDALNAEGYNLTLADASAWLERLYAAGSIDRDENGLYRGV